MLIDIARKQNKVLRLDWEDYIKPEYHTSFFKHYHDDVGRQILKNVKLGETMTPKRFSGTISTHQHALRLESEWTPQMMELLGIDAASLPIIWDADFLNGPRDASGRATYVPCRILPRVANSAHN